MINGHTPQHMQPLCALASFFLCIWGSGRVQCLASSPIKPFIRTMLQDFCSCVDACLSYIWMTFFDRSLLVLHLDDARPVSGQCPSCIWTMLVLCLDNDHPENWTMIILKSGWWSSCNATTTTTTKTTKTSTQRKNTQTIISSSLFLLFTVNSITPQNREYCWGTLYINKNN